MEVRFLSQSAIAVHQVAELPALLERDDGFVWVDIPTFDDEQARVLAHRFGFHDMALRACQERNHLPSTHAYQEYIFTILHAPLPGAAGHVHLLEIDQFVGRRYLVTVHGPLNPDVAIERALEETLAVLSRIERGRFRPSSPAELSYAIVTAVARRQRGLVTTVAEEVAALERRVMGDDLRNPEQLLEEMFLVRHELLTVRTMAAQSHDIFARLATLGRFVPVEDKPMLHDLADQFDRIRSLSDGEKEFLYGVIDLYQTRVATKMTVAVERLAVLAAVTLPITALASIFGMNVIVHDQTQPVQLVLILVLMIAISGLLLRWTKRQGWW